MTGKRFPPPWSIEDLGAAFVVKDSARHKLAYVYYEEEPGRRSAAKPAVQGRGAPDGCQFREVAGAVTEVVEGDRLEWFLSS
jgi:hypothetical protein